MSKKKSSTLAKVEAFVKSFRIAVAGMLTIIEQESARDVSEFRSRLKKFEILLDVHDVVLSDINEREANLRTLRQNQVESDRVRLERAKARVDRAGATLHEAEHTSKGSKKLQGLKSEMRKLGKRIRDNVMGIAHQDKLLKNRDLPDRKVVKAARLERIKLLAKLREERDAKLAEMNKLRAESECGVAKFRAQAKGARTRLRNIEQENEKSEELLFETLKAVGDARRSVLKGKKRAENKLGHLQRKALGRKVREEASKPAKKVEKTVVPAKTKPVVDPIEAKNARICELAKELGVKLSNDADRAVVHELVEAEFAQATVA